MAAARLTGGAIAPYLIVPILGGCAVFWTYVLGARLYSRQAGLMAATLLAASPIFLFQIVQPMSDVPTTAWWLLALLFATSAVPEAALAAGATSGLAMLTRPNLLPLLIAVLVALTLRRRPSPLRQTAHFIVGLLPAVGALLLLQWRLYGSPFASGYGSVDELFSTASIWPNALAYGRRLISGELPALVLLAAATTLLALVPRGARDDRQQHSLTVVVAIAAVTWAIMLACYLPYAVFAEWFYLRFLLPALPLLFILVASIAAVVLSRLLPRVGAIVMLLVVAVAGALNMRVAAREQAFHLRDFDARYRLAGEYLASALPPNAVIVTVQESGSLHHYTGRSVLRWDAAGLDLDASLATLRDGRRPAVLVVEDWEAGALRTRFPASAAARLDWHPRATIPGTTTVRVFDPDDRRLPSHVEDIVR
jgi:4-amino-4-deoxy-L-arabinose transferase-like glycosyltransferase